MEFYALLVLVILGLTTVDCYLPPSIIVCHRSDPDLDQCITDVADKLRPNIMSGDYGNGTILPAVDPAYVRRLDIDGGSSLKATFENCTIRGARTFHIDKLHFNVPKKSIKILVTLAEMNLTGKYSLNMSISLLQLDGQGDFTVNTSDVKLLLKIRYTLHEADNGRMRLQFLPIDFKVKFAGGVRFYLANLLNGRPELVQAANDALNQNPDLLLEKAIPAIRDFFSEMFTTIANGLVRDAYLDEVLPL
ncbi:uncharacterized protein LOC131682358 [Topomyia yanbarensis]|uniref:uncharacterized protein LOC131682358 n=1 Tax=Topomyia yanbarensis TaxID=2498891 RepID=UPI00273B1899|nr:uncharacterized protein LOC131682358 [Topomyia yanbarensis]